MGREEHLREHTITAVGQLTRSINKRHVVSFVHQQPDQ